MYSTSFTHIRARLDTSAASLICESMFGNVIPSLVKPSELVPEPNTVAYPCVCVCVRVCVCAYVCVCVRSACVCV